MRSLSLAYQGCCLLSSNLLECTTQLGEDTLANVKELAIGGPLCAVLTNGNVHCWGH